uniref:SF3 helicase domain-containing protein n=1 Tax=viral metagenome TaxID=1070528 RepID=A0A6C0JYF9_9ZZZZ
MAQGMTLQKFLDNHKADGVWTHTSLKGGKYFIPDDHKDQFYELYVESIRDQEKQYIVEKSSEIGPLRVDFDFIYGTDITKHMHTRMQVLDFVKAYMNEVQTYLMIPETTDVYIMEKRKPTLDTKKNKMKSGIHIVVPSVCTHKFVEQRVRRNLLKNMGTYFPSLPVTETWDKIYDEQVVNRSVPWTLYGSRKADTSSLPYLISYVVQYKDKNVSVLDEIPPVSIELMKTLSLVREDGQETPMTEEGTRIYAGLAKQEPEVRISGGNAVKPKRGRPASRGDKAQSRASSAGAGRVLLPPLEPERKEYMKQHTMNLKEQRYTDYSLWVQVGICLHNIHPDLLDVFLDFSSQDESKYNEAECIHKWNGFTLRNDGDRLGEGTLRYWSREDDEDEYRHIESTNVDRLLMMACSGTEHDVACVIHAKYRDNYICSDFGKNVWYRWAGHIWMETDRGIDLQLKLSKDIACMFLKKENAIGHDMLNRGLIHCTGSDGKQDCGMCDYCDMEKKRLGLNAMYVKLKTTRFKDNVMKECRELFFDEKFTKKVDSNKDIIAFNNGILDLITFEFRDGKPEDYMSFTTGIDYDPEKPYYEYEAWADVNRFIQQVLPDPEVREYFMKHLSTNLIGGNPAQKFHILTGSGSNGKSMITNLAATALGDYACTVPITLFTQKRGSSSSANPEVIRLKGRRMVTMQEPDESVALNTGLMKLVSSGEKMYARDLFKSGVEFEIQAKFHLACNDKPKINTTDGGTWRRLMVINFLSKFVAKPSEVNEFPMDETIQHKVVSVQWATPFLNYLVTILKEGSGYRKLEAPPKVMEYTSEYRNDTDGVAKFIADKLIPVVEGDEIVPVDKTYLRRVFKQWKDENDQKALSASDMEKRVEAKFGAFHRGGWTTFRID